MYEVRWSLTSGEVCKESFNESFDAWKKFYTLADSDGITYVGIHGLNGADAFEEMDSWSREIKTHEGGN